MGDKFFGVQKVYARSLRDLGSLPELSNWWERQ